MHTIKGQEGKPTAIIVIPLARKGGGAEKVASWLSHELTKRGWGIHVVTFWERTDEHEMAGIRHNAQGGIFRRARYVRRLALQVNPQAVITFTEEASASVLLAKIIGFPGKLLVAVRNNPSVRSLMSRMFIRVFYRKADLVIANSTVMAELLHREFHLKRVSVISNPVDVEENRRRSLEALPENAPRISADAFVFMTIGRLIPQKGHDSLIHAFAEVARAHRGTVLVLLGRGVLETELKQLTRDLGLDGRVIFAGLAGNVYSYLKRADCLVLASRFEGFPNVLLEALSLNVPCIATDCPTGPRELLAPELSGASTEYPYRGRYGVLVDADGRCLSVAMREAIETRCWSGRYSNSSDALATFDSDTAAAQWMKVLQ